MRKEDEASSESETPSTAPKDVLQISTSSCVRLCTLLKSKHRQCCSVAYGESPAELMVFFVFFVAMVARRLLPYATCTVACALGFERFVIVFSI